MKKKVAIWVIAILVIAILACGAIMLLKVNDMVGNTPSSGDEIGKITYKSEPKNSGEVKMVLAEVDKYMKDKPLDFFDEEIMVELPTHVGTKEMTEYADMQSFKLDEIDTKNYRWICTIENPENIAIESGETIFLYEQHGVGTCVDRIYKITGLKEGDSTIKMDCVFETVFGEIIKQESVVYKVSVDAEKKVALSESLRYQFKEMGYFPELEVYDPALEVGDDMSYEHVHEH